MNESLSKSVIRRLSIQSPDELEQRVIDLQEENSRLRGILVRIAELCEWRGCYHGRVNDCRLGCAGKLVEIEEVAREEI